MKQLLRRIPFKGYTGEIDDSYLDNSKRFIYFVYVYEADRCINYHLFNNKKKEKRYIKEKLDNKLNRWAKYNTNDNCFCLTSPTYYPTVYYTMKNDRLRRMNWDIEEE